ncbi:DUF1707 domain-containing protein [uncultured Corynebacterium sp.]|uniref:DUF1707 SHOCT-like domain-containing protein n=1 Tax=uncultured Corynebacterium sp. TaxID=159447 RepID=UPI00262565DF|nr:DUF1707 domain-containing protein [uncultured Corynebacterium sp.]
MSSDIEKTGDNLPRKRVSTSARQAAADLLSAALADGQLNIDDFDERNRQLWRVTYADELEALTADLSVPASVPQAPSPAITPAGGGATLTLSIMGGSSREGSWQIAPHHHSFTTMGGNLLDLRFAKLSAQETVINAVAIMGGMEIIVPENVRVISEGIGIMGGFGIEDHPSCSVSMSDLPPSAPTIRIRGIGLMGGVGIVRAAKDARVH